MFTFKFPITRLKIIVFLLLASVTGIAQSLGPVNPPNTVQSAFSKKFPGADNIKWERYPEEKKEFLADFIFDNIHLKAYFDKNGNWIETEKEIKTRDIPERVMLSIRTQYPHDKIIKAYEIEKDGKVMLYEIVLRTDEEKTSFVVSNDGYFTSR
jgi:hypothetical protein